MGKDLENKPLSDAISVNMSEMRTILKSCDDVTFHEFSIGKAAVAAAVIYIGGFADGKIINEDIIKPLTQVQETHNEPSDAEALITEIRNRLMEACNVEEASSFGTPVGSVLSGKAVLLLDHMPKALIMDANKAETRGVMEPLTESVVRGPREGFTEVLQTNTSMLRRKIKTPQLKLEKYVLGRETKTLVNIAYMEGIINAKIVKELRDRISRVDVDAILESAYIEELIEDTTYTLFPQIIHTERPDKVASAILEGQAAIFVDGTPIVMIVPAFFAQFMQSSEDYYERYPFAFFIRILRYIFALVALLTPGFYIASVTFHVELIPTPLLLSIGGAREGVPFPTLIEVLMMEAAFEIMREAGLRLPKQIGQALSIVGALVIGQASVQAGIVSPATVIVVALTGISSFAIPAQGMATAIRLLRFVFTILGGALGLYGMMLGVVMLLFHLASLRSFGIPYLYPVAPFDLRSFKEVFTRFPWWSMDKRPDLLSKNNRERQKRSLKPQPPENNKQ